MAAVLTGVGELEFNSVCLCAAKKPLANCNGSLHTIRFIRMVYTKINTRCYFNVQSKGDTSQLNLCKEPTTKKWKTEKKNFLKVLKNGYAQKYR